MGYHWYIDVEESSGTKFSAGPIVMQQDEQLSVTSFVTRVNQAFLNIYEDGLHDTLYTLKARLRPLPYPASNQSGPQTISLGAINTWNNMRDQRQFVVEYRVENNASRDFSLQFITGEHGTSASDTVAGTVNGQNLGSPPRAQVSVTNVSDVRPLLLPHATVTSLISDKPPVPPDIRFVPYRGENDKILILLAPNIGRRTTIPIRLEASDETFIVDEYYSQKGITITPDQIGTLTIPLEYASDDPVRTYEVFRVNRKPTSYSDFVNQEIARVEEQLSPNKFSTGASYLDFIEPNVRYYYCARSIDRHQNISNPTFVFEIELVDNAGQLFLRKKLFTFETEPQKKSVAVRRLLAIEPAQLQQVFEMANTNIATGSAVLGTAPPNNEIGAAADAVWDKKFKVRLISRKTGKKLDLNITFKNSGVTNP